MTEQERARKRTYYLANKERLKAYSLAYKKANPEKNRQYAADYADRNRDLLRGKARDYYREGREGMTDRYVKGRFVGKSALSPADVPDEMVPMLRTSYRIKNLLKEKNR